MRLRCRRFFPSTNVCAAGLKLLLFFEKSSRAGRCAGRNYPFLTQKERDVETGLDYFNLRYYAAKKGRFTSPDQPFMDQEEDDPQSWNLYSFVRNNPIKLIDPFGNAHRDANGNWVGDKDGEYDKDLDAWWRVDRTKELGGYWEFRGNQTAVEVVWTIADELELQQRIQQNLRDAMQEIDPDCEGCVMEMGGGRFIAQGFKYLFQGSPTSRLDRAMRARGLIRVANTAAHHIVARSARQASIARRFLRRFGIDIDAAENGVYLPSHVHQGLHTNAYYAKVERLLSAAATREEALAVLSFISSELQKGTFMSTP